MKTVSVYTIPVTVTIGGKRFILHSRHERKSPAQVEATKLRRYDGRLARVIKRGTEYVVYQRGK